jgi:CBS domain-containing protein
MRVVDVSTPLTVHIDPASSIRDAARLMRERHVGAVVVVDKHGNRCVPSGILTDRDIAISVVAAGIDPDAVTVRDVMSHPVATCTADQDIFDAILTMRSHGVRRLPMLDESGDFAGFVAADDVCDALAKELRGLSEVFAREQAREVEARP